MTHEDFVGAFPSDAKCLEHLKERFYSDGSECPGCGRASRFHPLRGRSAYSCQFCGTHVYPTAGTIFHRSRTGLQLWFWAIFLIGSTRGRISIAQLERELGVSYKTAQRMATRIGGLILEDGGEGVGQQEADVRTGVAERADPSRSEPEPVKPRAWHRARRRS